MSFPKLRVPRPPQNTKPAAGARQPEKPLGYVIDPAAAALGGRSTAAPVKVPPSMFVPAARAPQPPKYREYRDRHGNPSIHPDDIPF